MAISQKTLPVLLFVLLLVSTDFGAVKTVEAKNRCMKQSKTFHYNCITAHNWRDCARACRKEGFSGGKCKVDMALARPIPLCMCTRKCPRFN